MFEDDYLVKPNLLLVDDKTENLISLEKIISDMDCIIIKAGSGNEALEKLHITQIALILMNVQMPDMDGFKIAELIRDAKTIEKVPIIFITDFGNEKQNIFEVYKAGVIDFLFKPVEPLFLRNKVKMFLDFFMKKNELKEFLGIQEEISQKLIDTSGKLNQLNKKLQNEISARKAVEIELKEKNKILDEMSRFDPLTGLSNRRDILEKLEYEIIKFERAKRKFCIILSDIDHFKKINDTFGHDCGDFILKEISRLLINKMRKQDILSRWGGEEFLFFLPECTLMKAKNIAERYREGVEQNKFIYNDNTINLTMSFGISEYFEIGSIKECIKRADRYLYKAKNKGRNLVIFS